MQDIRLQARDKAIQVSLGPIDGKARRMKSNKLRKGAVEKKNRGFKIWGSFVFLCRGSSYSLEIRITFDLMLKIQAYEIKEASIMLTHRLGSKSITVS